MRHIILTIFILLTLKVYSQSEAKIEFNEIEYDFGTIGELDGAITHRFVYKNVGTAPLILNSVYTSCGCTSPAWSKEPVKPNNSGYVDVTFDPRDRPGMFTKSITVNSNSKNVQNVLYISGNVIPREEPISSEYPYSFFDLRLKKTTINFGQVTKGENFKQSVEIYNPTKSNLVVEPDIENIPNYLTITVSKKILKPGEKGEIKVELNSSKLNKWDYVDFDAGILVNTYKYNLHFKSIVSEKYTEKQKQTPPLIELLDGNTIDYNKIHKGETKYQKLRYKNIGQSELEIRAIRNLSTCISYKIETPIVKPGEIGTITIFFNSEDMKVSNVTKYISLVTNSPSKGHDIVVIKINAQIVE
ncbi:MAG: DUF1573 domain-containing protein [Bacteroidales bacterium]|nr:DUF1573 domain-containing protein [Bacteroidales bacterium]